jgi:hypothetical protein
MKGALDIMMNSAYTVNVVEVDGGSPTVRVMVTTQSFFLSSQICESMLVQN